jgi:hypothetical protein
MRSRAPLRNGARDQLSAVEVAMAEVDDDNVVYPLIGNDDLKAAGLVPEDDDDIHEDVPTLLSIDVDSGSPQIVLDASDGG